MYKEILYILIQRSYLYMANHRSIQILRASEVDSSLDNEKLLEGQPFYNETKNYLTIGKKAGSDGNLTSVSDFPITVRELVGYVDDSTKITNTKTNEYSLKYSNTDNSLNITSPTGININSGASNITIKRNNNTKIVVEESNIELDVNSLTVKPNTDNIATISTSSNNGFAFKDRDTRKANVEMGSLTISSRNNAQEKSLRTTISEGLVYTTEIQSEQYKPTTVVVSDELQKSVIKISDLITTKKDLYIAPYSNSIDSYVFNSGASLGGDGTVVAGTFKNANGSIKISESETILKNLNVGSDNATTTDDSGNITAKNVTSAKITGALNKEETPFKELEIDAREVYLYNSQFNVGTTSNSQKIQLDSSDGMVYCGQLSIRGNNTEETTLFEVLQNNTFDSDRKNADIQMKGDFTVKDGGSTATGVSKKGNITASGNVSAQSFNASGEITAQSFNALSDKRLKENIVEYSPNKSILDLPIYSYNFISDEKKTKKIGCLAQDLKEICPEIVKEDDNGYLSIEENKIVYLLLDEVKKLKKKVDELEAR